MQVGSQVLREQNLKRSNTACISLIHTQVTDSLPARGAPTLGDTQPPILALHGNTMLAAPPHPGHPESLPPTHSPTMSS